MRWFSGLEICGPSETSAPIRSGLGRYFRLLLIGYFEGIDAERGIAWRAADSLAVREFLRLGLHDPAPDHSTISRTRSYQEFLTKLAQASGIKTPTREALARLDRRRKKRTSNKDWTNPYEPDAKIGKMKDGRGRMIHKAEHAVDLDTGAIVAVTLQGGDAGDTSTIVETAIATAQQVEAQAELEEPTTFEEAVADKRYHSNQTMVDFAAVGVRTYFSEPDRGRRDWSKQRDAQRAVSSASTTMSSPRSSSRDSQ